MAFDGRAAAIRTPRSARRQPRAIGCDTVHAGWGADVVAELVGHPRANPEGLQMLGRTGRYLEIGNINPGLTFEMDPSQLIFKNATIYNVVYYEARHLQQAIDLVTRTRTKYPWQKVISHTFPLDRIEEAFEVADKGRVTRAAITM